MSKSSEHEAFEVITIDVYNSVMIYGFTVPPHYHRAQSFRLVFGRFTYVSSS